MQCYDYEKQRVKIVLKATMTPINTGHASCSVDTYSHIHRAVALCTQIRRLHYKSSYNDSHSSNKSSPLIAQIGVMLYIHVRIRICIHFQVGHSTVHGTLSQRLC